MSIIKAFHGQKTVMRYFYLISIIFFLFSCRHETEPPDVYEIIFRNSYFEKITSIEIANNIIEDINVGEKIIISGIPFGKQRITAVTQSGLIFEAVVILAGIDPCVNIVLTENGRLQIE